MYLPWVKLYIGFFLANALNITNIRQKYLPKAEGLLELLENCVEEEPKDERNTKTSYT